MTSHHGSHLGSQTASHVGVPPATPTYGTYGTYGTDGESGWERGNLTGDDAHARNTPNPPAQPPLRALARAVNCRYCDQPIYVAICRDGRWRSFERRLVPAAPTLVWAWRRHHGMEETEHSPGHHLHYCAGYDHFLNGAHP